MKKKILNPIKINLKKKILIESSAGTGKTFTIIIFFLRFLLGLFGKNKKPLKINEILIVTFTEFSKQDIKNKIKNIIYELRISCILKNKKHPILGNLIKEIINFDKSIKLLYLAELQIKKISIFTIHGFCYHILKNNIMILNNYSKNDIIKKNYKLLKKVINYFWVKYINNIPINLTKLIIKKWNSSKKLFLLILNNFKLIKLNNIKNCCVKLNFIKIYYKIINIINIFKKEWTNNFKNIFLNFNIKKINYWAKQKTLNLNYPKELIYLKKKYFIFLKNIKYFVFFNKLNIFLKSVYSLKKNIFLNITKYIMYLFNKKKKKKNIIDFEDIINKIYTNVKNNNNFSYKIYKKYPVAIIDEFHDIDYKQYKIFDYIYSKNNRSLILMGDPKQSIYSFRGVDINNYFIISKKINNNYYMNINWRSSYNMIKSVNFIFSINKKPFLSNKIFFIKSKKSIISNNKILIQNKNICAGLKIWLYSKKKIDIEKYENIMANQCSLNIYNLLFNKKYKTILINSKKKIKYLKKSDITIIVRNYHESYIIQNFLDKYNISYDNYVNKNEEIFNTSESKEILYILQAVINPNNKKFLLNALSTKILNKNFNEIYNINVNNNMFLEKYNEFNYYYLLWDRYGILSFINLLIKNYNIDINIINLYNGYNRFKNFLKLIKILNKKFFYLNDKKKLLYWLYKKNELYSKNNIYNKLNYIKKNNRVKIITVHKSKGLQYPLVWLPFISNFYNINNNNFKNNIIKEKKRLSEDLRILYVSLTRSIWNCNIGIAPIIKNIKNEKNKSDLHKSAIGYLFQKGVPMNEIELKKKIFNLTKNIKYIKIKNIL